MKKLIAIMLAAIMLVSMLVGCSSNKSSENDTPEEPTPSNNSAADDEFMVGLAFGALDLTPQILSENIIRICEENGWKYTMTNADQDSSKLLSDVESLCQMGCDVIICRGITDDTTAPIIDACYEAGIPLMLLSTYVESMSDKYLTLCNDTLDAAADMLAEWFQEYIDDHPGEYKVGYVVGDYSLESALCRWTTIRDKTDSVELVNGEGNWVASDAMSLVEDWLQTYPDMNVICSSSDEMTVGVIQALQDAGKNPDDFLVLSFDALDVMTEYIEQGWCDASAGIDLEKQARTICDICQKVKDGDTDDIAKVMPAYALYMCTTDNVTAIKNGTVEIDYYIY